MEAINTLSVHLDSRLLQLKEMRDKGIKIVGYVPNGYMPEELVYACGTVPVALVQGGEHEPVAVSVACLGRFMDTYCRAQIGYWLLREATVYQMLDLLVVPVTDHHVRAIAESWDFWTEVEVFRLGVPHHKTEHAFRHYWGWLRSLKEELERLTGVEITEQRLKDEIALSNELRRLFREISLMRRSAPPLISGKEFIRLMHDSFFADRRIMVEALEEMVEELKTGETSAPSGPRIMLTGSTLASGDYVVVDLLEQAGASIVIEEFSEGLRNYWHDLDVDGDPVRALAAGYFMKEVPGAFFRGAAKERFDFLIKLARDFSVDGVLWYSLMYRDTYDVEGYLFPRVLDKFGIQALNLRSNYDAGETGSFRTQIESFLETIARR